MTADLPHRGLETPAGACLVLGASGWLGREVLATADGRGWALGASRGTTPSNQLRTVRGPRDLSALVEACGVRTLVSCVGRAGGTEAELEEANIVVPTWVGQICRDHQIRLLHVGSAAEYGEQSVGKVPETASPRATGRYGSTKLAGTRALLDLAERGLDVTIARPFNIIGREQSPTTPIGEFARVITRLVPPTTEIRVRDSRLVRDYMSLRATAHMLLDVAGVRAAPSVVNICSGRGLAFAELILAMGRLAGLRVRIVDTAAGRSGIERVVGDPAVLHGVIGAREPEAVASLAALALQIDG